MLNLWRKIRRTGRVAEPAPPAPGGERPGAADALGGSVQVRHVDAGSCNGCEVEIGSAFGPVYDAERYGARLVASPRHADVLLVTGPVTRNMAVPLRRTYEAVPGPKLVVAVGDCARNQQELQPLLRRQRPLTTRQTGATSHPERVARMFKYKHDRTAKSAVPRHERGSAVGEFVSTLLGRIDHTRGAIEAAREAELPYEVELHHATLAALLRTADEHAIPVPDRTRRLEHH